MADKFRLEGADEALKKLKKVGHKSGMKAAKSADGKAAAEIRKAARRNAKTLDDPATPNQMHRNVASKYRKSLSKGDEIVYQVGVDVQLSAKGGFTPYYGQLELGNARQRAQPFLRPALKEAHGKAMDAFVKGFNKVLDKEIDKMR